MDPEAQSMLRPGIQTPPRNDTVLYLFKLLNVVTAIAEVLCLAAFAMAIYVRSSANYKDLYILSGQALRLLGIAFSALLLLVETEWRFILKLVPLLEMWVGRGIAQVFIACLTYREAYPQSEHESDFHKSLQFYRSVASAALLACAGIYIVGGVLCLDVFRRVHYKREENRAAAELEIEEIEKRKRELNRLLGRREV